MKPTQSPNCTRKCSILLGTIFVVTGFSIFVYSRLSRELPCGHRMVTIYDGHTIIGDLQGHILLGPDIVEWASEGDIVAGRMRDGKLFMFDSRTDNICVSRDEKELVECAEDLGIVRVDIIPILERANNHRIMSLFDPSSYGW